MGHPIHTPLGGSAMADLSQLSVSQLQARRTEIDAINRALPLGTLIPEELEDEERALWLEIVRRAVREYNQEAWAIVEAESVSTDCVEGWLELLEANNL